jgi:hypothetical protein
MQFSRFTFCPQGQSKLITPRKFLRRRSQVRILNLPSFSKRGRQQSRFSTQRLLLWVSVEFIQKIRETPIERIASQCEFSHFRQ